MGQKPSKQSVVDASSSTHDDVSVISSAKPEVPDIGPDDIVIAVMGLTGVGKSTFISHFSDTAVTGDNLESCTATLSIHPAQIDSIPKPIYLIDTPGFDDTTRSDTSILREIASWLERSYSADIKLTGIIYLHRIQDNRVAGSGVKNIRLFRELCGTDSLSSVVLATTMWDGVPDKQKAEEREEELKTKPEFWGELVEHGCAVLRQDEGVASATRIIQHIVDKRRPVTLQIQEEIAVDGKSLHETAAGEVLKADLDEQQRVHAAQMATLEEQLAKITAELADLQSAQARREQKAREEREMELREVEKREMVREEEIQGLKCELKKLNEDLRETRIKQEKVESEYHEFIEGSWWSRCAVM